MTSFLKYNALVRIVLLGLILSLASVATPAEAQAQQEPPAEEPAVDEQPTEAPAPAEGPAGDEPPADVPTGDEAPSDGAAGDEAPSDGAAGNEPPAVDEEPAVDVTAAHEPVGDEEAEEMYLAGPGQIGGVFAEGTDPDYVDQFLDGFNQAPIRGSGGDAADARFLPSRHWDPAATALNNGGRNQGDSIELTWSIIPDGTVMPAVDSDDTTCNSNLIATFDSIYGAGNWQAEVQRVWDDWTEKTGNIYTPAVGRNASGTPIDDGARWPTSPGVLGVRGDIRIGGCNIDGDSGTLAFNFYPGSIFAGDMKIDATDRFYAQTSLSPGMHNVFSHEHGHGTGLAHVCPINRTKLMEPFLTTRFTGLQHDDLRGIQRGYGDRFELINNPNDSQTAATPLSPVGGQTEQELSLDSVTDEDWFRFTGTAGKFLNVSVTPVGETYLEGATENGSCQNVAGTLIDTASFINLSVEIRNSTGRIAILNSNPAGVAERLAHFELQNSGTHYVRITGTGVDATQLYDLSIELSDPAADSVCPAIMEIGLTHSGLLARDAATGNGFVMWSAEDVHDRFVTSSTHPSADHLAVVSYDNGWLFHDNDVLIPFQQAPDDCLVAALDFDVDTAVTLRGTSQLINGIDAGYRNGDLIVIANQWDGDHNIGEFDVSGTQIGDVPDTPDSACPLVMAIGAINSGMLARDAATGNGYVMWSNEDVHDRFVTSSSHPSADHLAVVSYDNGWFFHDNDVLIPFFQTADDCLVAALDFDADTAITLQGANEIINGIDAGYPDGDLTVIANQWNGGPNPGEFDATGTEIGGFKPVPDSMCPPVMGIGAINSGMLAQDNATGGGYVMWSAEDVHDRFVHALNHPTADHLTVVSYDDGWFYHDNDVLVPFQQASDDCLVAALDFGANTAVMLEGVSEVVNGIDSGYVNGDVEILPEQWNGEVNPGEFDVAGTELGGVNEVDCTNPFADVETDLFFTEPVVWAVCSGITTGTHTGTPALFTPAGALTRGQMATLLWRYAGRPTPSATPHGFTDVADGVYYSVPIQWLAEMGITTGTGDGTTFSPNAIVTRAQMATFLWRFQGQPGAPGHAFVDVPPGVFFEASVGWLSDTGITTGTGDGTTFSPNVDLTRGQAVTFLHRLFSL